MRREKKAWAENRGQGGIPWTDDITAPTARTRFESVQEAIPSLLPWVREKQSAPSTPSVDGAGGMSPEGKPGSSHEANTHVNGTDATDRVDGVSKETTESVHNTPHTTDSVPGENVAAPDSQQPK